MGSAWGSGKRKRKRKRKSEKKKRKREKGERGITVRRQEREERRKRGDRRVVCPLNFYERFHGFILFGRGILQCSRVVRERKLLLLLSEPRTEKAVEAWEAGRRAAGTLFPTREAQ